MNLLDLNDVCVFITSNHDVKNVEFYSPEFIADKNDQVGNVLLSQFFNEGVYDTVYTQELLKTGFLKITTNTVVSVVAYGSYNISYLVYIKGKKLFIRRYQGPSNELLPVEINTVTEFIKHLKNIL